MGPKQYSALAGCLCLGWTIGVGSFWNGWTAQRLCLNSEFEPGSMAWCHATMLHLRLGKMMSYYQIGSVMLDDRMIDAL